MIITDQLGRHYRAVADQSQDAVRKERKSERERSRVGDGSGWLESGSIAKTKISIVQKVADSDVMGNLRNYRRIAGKYNCY